VDPATLTAGLKVCRRRLDSNLQVSTTLQSCSPGIGSPMSSSVAWLASRDAAESLNQTRIVPGAAWPLQGAPCVDQEATGTSSAIDAVLLDPRIRPIVPNVQVSWCHQHMWVMAHCQATHANLTRSPLRALIGSSYLNPRCACAWVPYCVDNRWMVGRYRM
jgi:hypothetical protein